MSSPQDVPAADSKAASFEAVAEIDNISEVTVVDLFDDGTIDPVYRAKSHLISAAIQSMGMGKYQVRRRRLPEVFSKS